MRRKHRPQLQAPRSPRHLRPHPAAAGPGWAQRARGRAERGRGVAQESERREAGRGARAVLARRRGAAERARLEAAEYGESSFRLPAEGCRLFGRG